MPVADLRGRRPGARRRRTARSSSPPAAPSSTPRAPTPSPRSINLALALGLPGRPGSGYGCLTGQGNGQGGREHGQKADQLPGYRRIDDPAARAHVAGVWGVDPDDLPGPGRARRTSCSTRSARRTARGRCWCSAPTRWSRRPGPARRAPAARAGPAGRRRLRASETAALADVVLPIAQWAEEDGTMTNLEGRVLRRRALRAPPPGRPHRPGGPRRAWPRRLGRGRSDFPTEPRTVFDELRRASRRRAPPTTPASPRSGSTPRTASSGPARRRTHPGTPRLFAERFATPDGRARFLAGRAPAGRPRSLTPTYPLYLTTGRVLAQYQSGAQTRRVAALHRAAPGAVRRAAPRPGRAGSASATASRCGWSSRRGELRGAGPGQRRRSGRTPSSCRSTGPARRRANSVTNDAARPDLRGCRSSRSAPSGVERPSA